MLDLVLAASLNSSNASLPQEPQKIAGLRCGIASWYGIGDGFHGRETANGEIFNAYGVSAASTEYPLGAVVRVTNQNNGSSVVVRINDRGPYGTARIDLSYGAFDRIENPDKGRVYVCIRRIDM